MDRIFSSFGPISRNEKVEKGQRIVSFTYRNFEISFMDVIALGGHLECCTLAYIITFHKIDPMDFDTSWGQIFRLCLENRSLEAPKVLG